MSSPTLSSISKSMLVIKKEVQCHPVPEAFLGLPSRKTKHLSENPGCVTSMKPGTHCEQGGRSGRSLETAEARSEQVAEAGQASQVTTGFPLDSPWSGREPSSGDQPGSLNPEASTGSNLQETKMQH